MRADFITRRVFARKRWLLWHIERDHGRDVRRVLIDLATGEILDEVWRTQDGHIRSYGLARPDPPGVDEFASARVDNSSTAVRHAAGSSVVEGDDPCGHPLAA